MPEVEELVYAESKIWQYRIWSFRFGETELVKILPKNKCAQRKLQSPSKKEICQALKKMENFDFLNLFVKYFGNKYVLITILWDIARNNYFFIIGIFSFQSSL